MLINKVLNFAAEGFCQTDNHIDLGFAQVILFLLIKLHHAQRNAGGIAELLLGKSTGFADGMQLGLPGFFVASDNGIGGFNELAVISFVVNIHGENGGEGQPIRNDILEPSAALEINPNYSSNISHQGKKKKKKKEEGPQICR